MKGRRDSGGEGVSLFPFLSILACVIGILMLMITAISLGQIGRDSEDSSDPQAAVRAAERVDRFKELQQQIQQHQALRNQLQSQLADLQNQADSVRKERNELARLREPPSAEMARQLAGQQASADALASQIRQLEKDIAELDPRLKELRDELARRQEPPREADVIIQPSGSGRNLRPYFVECAANSIVLHTSDPPQRIPRSQLASNETFLQLLAALPEQSDAIVIFLIRPDGVATYNTARNVARSHYVRNGKLPVATQGRIDLSRYREIIRQPIPNSN